jgi:hypothetical protein
VYSVYESFISYKLNLWFSKERKMSLRLAYESELKLNPKSNDRKKRWNSILYDELRLHITYTWQERERERERENERGKRINDHVISEGAILKLVALVRIEKRDEDEDDDGEAGGEKIERAPGAVLSSNVNSGLTAPNSRINVSRALRRRNSGD